MQFRVVCDCLCATVVSVVFAKGGVSCFEVGSVDGGLLVCVARLGVSIVSFVVIVLDVSIMPFTGEGDPIHCAEVDVGGSDAGRFLPP
jgi:hypothetical protein